MGLLEEGTIRLVKNHPHADHAGRGEFGDQMNSLRLSENRSFWKNSLDCTNYCDIDDLDGEYIQNHQSELTLKTIGEDVNYFKENCVIWRIRTRDDGG